MANGECVQKGTGNIERTFWCPFCGKTSCGGECVVPERPYEEEGVSIRAKGEVRMAKFVDEEAERANAPVSSAAFESGRSASKEDLQEFLAGYLGDKVFARRFSDCIDTLRAKNADYSQNEQKGDRIAAFRRIARDIDLPMRKVWAVFAQKHWGAIMRFVKEGRVESEPIDGRIDDLINYAVLFGAIVRDERHQESHMESIG
jgi:hypothetical protein